MTAWTVAHERIVEQVVEGKRLGRVVRHDSRSLAYRYRQAGTPLQTMLWGRHEPIWDQGLTSACTGEAEAGALATSPLFETLPTGRVPSQALAMSLYSAAEIIDGGPGLPSEDIGSSGLSVCQAALNAGLISGYTHCLSLADVLDALQHGPVILGTNWYAPSFDNPSTGGLIKIRVGDTIRGGHEFVCRGIDVSAQVVFCDNSWGASWGLNGSFEIGWTTLDRLLSEQGDGTVSVPLTAPAPVPTPPPSIDPDVTLADAVRPWVAGVRTRPDLIALQRHLRDWLSAKHLT